jgi:hypothetical protein
MQEAIELTKRTSDIYYAAYVVASGIALSGAAREGKRVFFLFEVSEEEWEERTSDYFTGSGVVRALDMTSAIKALKSLVHVT